MPFKTAVKHESKLRLAIAGPSGSGKTYTSLAIATALAQGKPIALVDTEHGSASKYADLFAFDVLEIEPPFHPDRFGKAIIEAAAAGYAVVILDSLTHAWQGSGGLLDEVDRIARQMRSPNTFAAWKDATPIQNRLVEAIVGAPLHVIATMRSKQDYILTVNEKGNQVPKKVGMAPQQREGFEYEFDVFGEMDTDNTLLITKTRCPALTGGVYKKPGKDVAAILTTWLQGVKAPDKPAATTTPPSQPAPATQQPPAPPAEASTDWADLQGNAQTQAAAIRSRILEHAADAAWKIEPDTENLVKKVNQGFGIAFPNADERHAIREYLLSHGSEGYTKGEVAVILGWLGITKDAEGHFVPLASCLADAKTILAALAQDATTQPEAPAA
jgi:hypothetical protein